MSRSPGEVAADILLNPGMVIMVGAVATMLVMVIRAATASGRDRALMARSKDIRVIPVIATFAGLRGISPRVAIATNSAGPLFAVGAEGIAYRVIRKHDCPFADIENINVRRGWHSVNVEFRLRGRMLTLAVNAGTDATARAILSAIPDNVPMTWQATILRNGGCGE